MGALRGLHHEEPVELALLKHQALPQQKADRCLVLRALLRARPLDGSASVAYSLKSCTEQEEASGTMRMIGFSCALANRWERSSCLFSSCLLVKFVYRVAGVSPTSK